MDEKLQIYSEKMIKTYDNLLSDFNAIRAGRANPHILDKIVVDYYGTSTPLNQVSNVSVPDPRTIMITPWDKSVIPEIEKAINASDVGINPTVDGANIRLVIPELTEDRRKEIVKDIKKRGEESKVAIRNIRRDGNDMLKKLKGGELSEDTIKDMEDDLQKLTDENIKKIDDVVDIKSKEILTV